MSEEKEIITLSSAGAIPGLPGSHGPGTYEVDWATRTLKRVVDGVAVEEAVAEEEEGEPAPVAVEPPPAPVEPPTTEVIFLPSGGAIPGLPGHHGPGAYQVDWQSRTVKRLVDGVPVDEAEAGTAPVESSEEALVDAPATGVPLVGISLPADGIMREVTLEGAPPESAPPDVAPPAPVEPPAPDLEPEPAEAPAPDEEEPAAPDEASEQA